MYQITDKLAVGNVSDAENPPASIGALLMVAAELSVVPPVGMAYDRIPLKEYGEAGVSSLDQAVAWIEAHLPESRVLVCCRAGMGRSVSVVLAYLCCAEDMAYPDALNLLLKRRPGAVPLPNLRWVIEAVQQLRESRKAADASGLTA
ncbi:MAG TPA: dual specificity protein phosphatase [Nitrospira sp.]|nr:dual specificity protein phosphatase [Nitrospira sp.]